jgi:hypothetical protein
VDEFVIILVVMFLGVILDLIKKAQRKKQPPPLAAEQEEMEAGDEPVLARNIQDLIAEELGLNLERRPSVQRPPEPEPERKRLEEASSEWARTRQPAAQSEPQRQPVRAADRTAETLARRRGAPAKRRSPDLKERGHNLKRREPAEALSLERPRRPEDHDRFHERYNVPQPVTTHSEFHARYMAQEAAVTARRPRGPLLPDRPGWTAVQKAIIWAEIIGPPKGLSEE